MPFEPLIFPGYLRVITKEVPKCKRLEFVVSASHYEMHVMCVATFSVYGSTDKPHRLGEGHARSQAPLVP